MNWLIFNTIILTLLFSLALWQGGWLKGIL
jgi:hypothetical protein